MKRGLQIAAACIVVLIGAFAVGSAVAGPFFWYSCSLNGLDAHGPARASIILASDGTHLGLLGATGNRQPVSMRRISPVMRKAIVDTEDRRFYSNNGIDYIGIVRALKERRLVGRVHPGRVDDRAAAGTQPLPHAAAVDQPQAHRGAASPSSSTSSGARTASSRRTSTTSTSARRRTGSKPRPRRTSACTPRISRSSRRRSSPGCRRRRRRTTRSTGRTPRKRAGRRCYGRCSRQATSPVRVTDRRFTAHSACTRERRPGSRDRHSSPTTSPTNW